jgi:beta-galactosidase
MPHVIGDFVWTALDYLGEAGLGHVWYDDNPAFLGANPWHLANCGDYDICGFERPQLALRRQLWNSGSKPYLAVLRPDRDQARAKVSAWGWPEVLPFWDWADHAGKPVQVVVYARAPEVRLSLNGRELGRRPCGLGQGCQCSFEVPYEPGRLLARTYDGDTLLDEIALETPDRRVRCVWNLTSPRCVRTAPTWPMSRSSWWTNGATGRAWPTGP